MGNNIKDQREVARHEIWDRKFAVERTTWSNSPGLSFDVIDVQTGQCLTAESYDDEPTPEEIEDLLDQLKNGLEEGYLDPLFDHDDTKATLAVILVKPCGYIGCGQGVSQDMYCPDCGRWLG